MRRLLAIAALTAVLAACGSAGGPESEVDATPPGATVARTSSAAPAAAPAAVPFDDEANEICSELQRRAAVVSRRRPTDDQLTELVAGWQAGFGRLDALEPPPPRAAAFAEMLRHYRRMAEAMNLMIEAEDESVLAAAAGAVVEGQRGTRAARRAGLDACALVPEIEQPPADPQSTFAAADALVPKQAAVVRDDDPGCSDDGSCRIEFELAERSLRARVDAAIARLRAEGWERIDQGPMANVGAWVTGFRGDHAAVFDFVSEPPPEHCRHRADAPFCRDAVWVHRVEVPEVLTGG